MSFVSALDYEREYRLNFGHVVRINSVGIENNLVASNLKTLNVDIENTANFSIYDIRVEVNLPDEVAFFEDISKRKVARLESGESVRFSYDLIYSSDIAQGIHEARILIDYVNHIGDEKQDNDTFSIILKDSPKFFVQVEDTQVYKKNDIGDVTLKFINNHLADIKFLTVELKNTEDCEVISSNREYIGDLDSDDFETAEFKIKSKKSKSIPLNILINYKDTYNNEISEQKIVNLPMYSTGSAIAYGLKKSKNSFINIIFYIIILLFLYSWYKEWRRQKDIGKGFKIVFKRWILKIIDFFNKKNLKQLPNKFKNYFKR